MGASYGTFGVLPKLAANTYFGYEGVKGLISPEGVAKTVNFVKQGRGGRAVLSGIGDLFNLTLARQGLKGIKTLNTFAKEIPYVAKFNWMNRNGSFRMDYPWQRTPETLPERLTLEHIAEEQTPKYNSSQITGHFGKVKYYGPTMGKTTAVTTNPRLVDFDDLIRQPSRSILDRFGFRTKSEMYNSGNQEAVKAYEDMLIKTLRDWRANPQNQGQTLMASPTAVANPNQTGFYFDNVPSIPSRSTFVTRNVARGGTPEASNMWYNSLLERNPNLKIDDRFISEIEKRPYVSPNISQLEMVPQSDFTPNFTEPARIPGNDIDALNLNFSNYFGKPIEDVTVDDWNSFINGNPIQTYGLNINNILKEFNYHKGSFKTGNTYHGQITGENLLREIRQMSRDRVPYDMSKHQDVLDYMREYVSPQYINNFREAAAKSNIPVREIDIDRIKDVFANPSKYIHISHGYVQPGSGGSATGWHITVPFDIDFTDRAFAHELHHAIRNYLHDYLKPNYNPVFGYTSPIKNKSLMSGEVSRAGQQPYFDSELEAMQDLAFNKIQSSDKTPSSEIGATITSEYAFPRFMAMKNALGRFPTNEELWNAMDNSDLETINVPLAYRDAIGSAYRDARRLHWADVSQTQPQEAYNRLMQQWKSKPLLERIWNMDQKPTYRGVSERIKQAHKTESINNFKNAIKRVMTSVPTIGLPFIGHWLSNNTKEQENETE